MKYCISYYKNFRHLDEVDEIIFPYSDNLPAFFEEKKFNKKQRILIHIGEKDLAQVVPTLRKIQTLVYNMAVIAKRHTGVSKTLTENGIEFFYSDYCKTFDQVYTFKEEGVSDIYVVETLGFDLKEIGTYCHDYDVNVRVLPNVLQSTLGSTSRLPQVCHFFIRPDDVKAYESYVDVFELFGDEEKYSITYEIYKDEHWDDDLQFVIKGITKPMYISPELPFGEYRLKCRQRCYSCTLCERLQDFEKELKKGGLTVKKQEEE